MINLASVCIIIITVKPDIATYINVVLSDCSNPLQKGRLIIPAMLITTSNQSEAYVRLYHGPTVPFYGRNCFPVAGSNLHGDQQQLRYMTRANLSICPAQHWLVS